MRRPALVAFALLAGCDDGGGEPSTLITGPRVLAVAAEPPVTTIDGAATLRALIVDGDGAPLAVDVAWRVCSPWSPLRDPDVDCGPDQALALPADGEGAARLVVADVLARFGGPAAPIPPPAPCELDSVPIPVIATAVVDGVRLVARKDVGVAAVARRAPVIAAVTLDDGAAATFTPGATHRIAATPVRDALDTRCTADPEPVPVLEGVRAYFYVTAGTLGATSADVVFQPDGSERVDSVELDAPTDVDRVRLWTVMIDGDGGAAWDLRELARSP